MRYAIYALKIRYLKKYPRNKIKCQLSILAKLYRTTINNKTLHYMNSSEIQRMCH